MALIISLKKRLFNFDSFNNSFKQAAILNTKAWLDNHVKLASECYYLLSKHQKEGLFLFSN